MVFRCLTQCLRQHSHIAQGEIESLPRHRVQRMRSIADHNQVPAHLFFTGDQTQGIHLPTPHPDKGSQPIAKPLL